MQTHLSTQCTSETLLVEKVSVGELQKAIDLFPPPPECIFIELYHWHTFRCSDIFSFQLMQSTSAAECLNNSTAPAPADQLSVRGWSAHFIIRRERRVLRTISHLIGRLQRIMSGWPSCVWGWGELLGCAAHLCDLWQL
jgi:hypothetical protein